MLNETIMKSGNTGKKVIQSKVYVDLIWQCYNTRKNNLNQEIYYISDSDFSINSF